MELVIFGLVCAGVGAGMGGIVGYMLADNTHKVATGIKRATTLPQTDVEALNKFSPGLGDRMQVMLGSAAKPVIAAAANIEAKN